MDAERIITLLGGFCFGLVVGWTTYFIVRRAKPSSLTDIATVVGAVGGAAVTGLFDSKGALFGAYAVGLAVGFFAYYVAYMRIVKAPAVREALIKQQDSGGTVLE